MSCCNSKTTGQVLVDPCSTCNEASATNEALPSALDNFIAAFFGTLEKSVVDGKVVWTLPCNLNVGLENNPRQDGEGLACYFLRLFEAGIIGLTGPQGDDGPAGEDGKDGYSTVVTAVTNASAECPNIAVQVLSDEPYSAGLYVFIPFAGYFLINEVQDNVVYLSLVQLSTNAVATIPVGSPVVPAGPSGSQGAKGDKGDAGLTGAKGDKGDTGATGDTGLSAQAELLSGFVQPSANVTVGFVTLSREIYASPGQFVWIGGVQVGGYYEVLAAAGTQIQIRNSGDVANAAPGTAIPASSPGNEEWVVVCGPKGITDIPTTFSWKEPVRLVSDSNKALTGSATIDGVATANSDRVLLAGQTNDVENGIWDVNHGGAWTRAVDADDTGELPAGTATIAQEGDVYQHTTWLQHALDVVPGTDSQVWNEFGTEAAYGEMYINAGAVGVAFSGANTWTKVTSLSEGLNKGFTFATSAYTCDQAGVYEIHWKISFLTSSASADVIHGGVAKNTTIQAKGRASRTCTTTNGYGTISGNLLISLAPTDTIELQVMNATDTDGITIQHADVVFARFA